MQDWLHAFDDLVIFDFKVWPKALGYKKQTSEEIRHATFILYLLHLQIDALKDLYSTIFEHHESIWVSLQGVLVFHFLLGGTIHWTTRSVPPDHRVSYLVSLVNKVGQGAHGFQRQVLGPIIRGFQKPLGEVRPSGAWHDCGLQRLLISFLFRPVRG